MNEEYLQLNGLKCDTCGNMGVWYIHESIVLPDNDVIHVASCGGKCGTIGVYHTATGELRAQVNLFNHLRSSNSIKPQA